MCVHACGERETERQIGKQEVRWEATGNKIKQQKPFMIYYMSIKIDGRNFTMR